MKRILLTFGIFNMIAILGGCNVHVNDYDHTPPAPPQGIISVARDHKVDLSWLPNTERNLSGYNVYVSSSFHGRYELIGSTKVPHFTDYGAKNGVIYYYAITAYDYDGNESEFSYEEVYATPRPEGNDVAIYDYKNYPNDAGYDFSTYSVGPYNDKYTDIFFEYANGVYYMNVWDDTDIQDMGYTVSLDDIATSPRNGWSPTKDVQLIVGHTYVVWTWDDHFAKFRVKDLKSNRVVFDWAYQLVEGNASLKVGQLSSGQRAPISSHIVRIGH